MMSFDLFIKIKKYRRFKANSTFEYLYILGKF